VLYEASPLAFEGEMFLDEARNLSTKALIELMPSMHRHKRHFVARAMDTPLHWTAPRLYTRWFIDHYTCGRYCPLTLQFAKVDFNNVQNVYRQEFARLTSFILKETPKILKETPFSAPPRTSRARWRTVWRHVAAPLFIQPKPN
jgi:hypothetical protein